MYFLFFLNYLIRAFPRMSRDLLTPRELGEPTSQSGRQITKNPGSQTSLGGNLIKSVQALVSLLYRNFDVKKKFVHTISPARHQSTCFILDLYTPDKLSNTQKKSKFYDDFFFQKKQIFARGVHQISSIFLSFSAICLQNEREMRCRTI